MVTPGPVPPQPLTCGVDQYQCVYYFQCLPKSWRCDDELDCADGSDEESCLGQVPGTIPPQGGCPTGQYRCLNHSCLPSILRCDGVPDCPEGEDEYSCREFAFASVKLFKHFKDHEPSSPPPPPTPNSFCLHQLCSNANWENWCVKLRPVVFRSTSVATALPTACLFTLMSPAAMVTFTYVSSLSRFSPSHKLRLMISLHCFVKRGRILETT